MANPTINDLHIAWYYARTESTLSALLEAVRKTANKAGSKLFNDRDDFAQEVVMRVWQNLSGFIPTLPDSFARWLSVIIKNERRHQFDAHKHISSDGLVETPTDEPVYTDISFLPDSLKPAARHILAGYTIKEAAQIVNLSDTALRQRFRRYRKK